MSTIRSSSKSHASTAAAHDLQFLVWFSYCNCNQFWFFQYILRRLKSLNLAPVFWTMIEESSKSNIKARLEADKPTHVFAVVEDLADYTRPTHSDAYLNALAENIHATQLLAQCCQEMNIHCTLFHRRELICVSR